MSDEDEGHSEEKTDFWGNKYIQHYDSNGEPDGYTTYEKSFFGDTYEQHHKQDGTESSYTTYEKDFWGNSYEQHHDQSGEKTGYTTKEEGILGDKYDEHRDDSGKKTGYSEDKTSFLGAPYRQHHGTGSRGASSKEEPPKDNSAGMEVENSEGTSFVGGGEGAFGVALFVVLVVAAALIFGAISNSEHQGHAPAARSTPHSRLSHGSRRSMRARSVSGHWVGAVQWMNGGQPGDFQFKMALRQTGNKIEGLTEEPNLGKLGAFSTKTLSGIIRGRVSGRSIAFYKRYVEMNQVVYCEGSISTDWKSAEGLCPTHGSEEYYPRQGYVVDQAFAHPPHWRIDRLDGIPGPIVN